MSTHIVIHPAEYKKISRTGVLPETAFDKYAGCINSVCITDIAAMVNKYKKLYSGRYVIAEIDINKVAESGFTVRYVGLNEAGYMIVQFRRQDGKRKQIGADCVSKYYRV